MHLLTQSALLQALGWSLFNSLWQMGSLWLLYRLFIGVFNDASARLRHGLALSLLAAGTLWSVLSFVSTYFAFSGGAAAVPDGSAGGWVSTGSAALMRPILWPVHTFIAALVPYGSSLYLIILAGLLVRYCYHYLYSTKLSREGLSRIQPGFRVFVTETSRRMGIRPAVSVWLSTMVDVPVTLGFLKPVILLPLAMASNLTTQQVEAILVHELAHIRRKDFLLNLVVTVLEGLFFFNPFTRWLIADLKKEREHCCDDLVLQFRYDPHAYVSALLSLARQSCQTRLVVAATGSGSDQLLLQRARRILLQQRTGDQPGARPFALLLLTLMMTLVTLSRPSRPAPAAQANRARSAQANQARSTQANQARSTQANLARSAQANLSQPIPSGSILAVIEVQATPLISNQEPASVSRPAPLVSHTIHSPHLARPPKPTPTEDQDQPEEDLPLSLVAAVGNPDLVTPDELVADTRMDIRKDNREYSIGKMKVLRRVPAKAEGLPFVPRSSFSWQRIEEDTLRPEEKLAQAQVEMQKEVVLGMQRLQLDLMAQLELVKARQKELLDSYGSGNEESLREQRDLLEKQIQLQKSYIQQLDRLQKKLKQARRRLTIVYI